MSTIPAPIPNEASSNMNAPASEKVFVNLLYLHEMQDVLAQSHELRDAELHSWIHNHFFHLATEDPDPEARKPIKTVRGVELIYEAFLRVQHLTNRAVEKWPFVGEGGNRIQQSVVRKMIEAHNGIDAPSTVGSQGSANVPISASAEPEITNLDKLPMSSSRKQPKRKSETVAGASKQNKKPRGGRGASTTSSIVDTEGNTGSAQQSALINAHGGETPTHVLKLRVPGHFAKSSLATTPKTSLPSSTTQDTHEQRSIAKNDAAPEEDVNILVPNLLNVNGKANTDDKAPKDSRAGKLSMHDLKNEQVAPITEASTSSLSSAPTAISVASEYATPQAYGSDANTTNETVALFPNLDAHAQARSIIFNNTPTPASNNFTPMTNVTGTAPIVNASLLGNGTPTPAYMDRELVQFLARIRTPGGDKIIVLDPSLFTGQDVDLIHRYAAWKQEETGTGMNLSFEQFCKVLGFATVKVEE